MTRATCPGCHRLTHVAELLYVLLREGWYAWRCARCVEDLQAAAKR